MKKKILLILLMVSMGISAKNLYKEEVELTGFFMTDLKLDEYCEGNSICEHNLMKFSFDIFLRQNISDTGQPCYSKILNRESERYIKAKYNIDNIVEWRKEQFEKGTLFSIEMEVNAMIQQDLGNKIVDLALLKLKNTGAKGSELFPKCDN